MARQFPQDTPVQILHALRIGLCEKVEQGSITFIEATDLINEWSNMLIQERAEEERQVKGKDL